MSAPDSAASGPLSEPSLPSESETRWARRARSPCSRSWRLPASRR